MSTTDDTNATRRGSESNDLLGPMPEPPTFYRYQFQSHYGPVWRSSAENWNGCPPLASEGLYSADQMRVYAAEQVAAERERCARLAEHQAEYNGLAAGWHIAAEIRGA